LIALTSVWSAAFAETNLTPKPPITKPVTPPKAANSAQPVTNPPKEASSYDSSTKIFKSLADRQRAENASFISEQKDKINRTNTARQEEAQAHARQVEAQAQKQGVMAQQGAAMSLSQGVKGGIALSPASQAAKSKKMQTSN
jgi:hypothetical protein